MYCDTALSYVLWKFYNVQEFPVRYYFGAFSDGMAFIWILHRSRLLDCSLTLLVEPQEGHLACKNVGCWFVGGDNLTGALHIL